MKLSLIPNIFPDEIQVEYHHALPDIPLVIPLPKTTHRYKLGNIKKHYSFNKKMVEKLYGLNIEKLFKKLGVPLKPKTKIKNKESSDLGKGLELKGTIVFAPLKSNWWFERKVHKSNERSGKITLPVDLIGKKVYVVVEPDS